MSHYQPTLSVRQTQKAIKFIRDTFQYEFGKVMHLERISAPLFVSTESGLNDHLSGIERPVSFKALKVENTTLEVVQSLAKWKRFALKKYGFQNGEGLYTNMNAIRRDEIPDATHSFYVDQWDWERSIPKENRCKDYLEETVRSIFKVIKHMEHEVWYKYPQAVCPLANEVHFLDSQELFDLYPNLSAKEREKEITRRYGCVFIERIGDTLKGSNKPHDQRAADYDDWQLNGDLFFWLPQLEQALELSSMGIRVDEHSLLSQCESSHCCEKLKMPYHQMILHQELPYSIGGGIGQSRLCMLLLNKAHIGEVQASYWPEEILKECDRQNIPLL